MRRRARSRRCAIRPRASAASPGSPARHGSAGSRATPSARMRSFACWSRSRPRRRSTSSSRSRRSTVSTASSSGRPISRRASAMSASRAIRRSRPIIEDAIGRIRACGKPAGILTPDNAFAARCIELGTTFTAVGVDAAILARATEALAAQFRRLIAWRLEHDLCPDESCGLRQTARCRGRHPGCGACGRDPAWDLPHTAARSSSERAFAPAIR